MNIDVFNFACVNSLIDKVNAVKLGQAENESWGIKFTLQDGFIHKESNVVTTNRNQPKRFTSLNHLYQFLQKAGYTGVCNVEV